MSSFYFMAFVYYFVCMVTSTLPCLAGAGESANIKRPVTSEPIGLQRDSSHVTTLTELGKKLVEAAKVGDTNQVRRLMAIGAPFASDGVNIIIILYSGTPNFTLNWFCKRCTKLDPQKSWSINPMGDLVPGSSENSPTILI